MLGDDINSNRHHVSSIFKWLHKIHFSLRSSWLKKNCYHLNNVQSLISLKMLIYVITVSKNQGDKNRQRVKVSPVNSC